ncbi:T9SS type A sorting domain-containing protein [Flavobacterium sp. SM15]|uniref:T9SS type A sorting domain-containing protein n=1 Tax=Flavobacterium sp. SM15 TaxID=2908005 RepID=UPI001EDA4C28|nr:T9SS type A sorting domain-containing protein [Flavobacterium sp. SM15]MCG2610224.1 T9SS type A sorting domain-containing protein [Flavobacterium sp. SM15]
MNIITFSKKKFYFLFIVFFSFIVSGLQAQTAPENTRLIQINQDHRAFFYKIYCKHLKTQNSDLFISCLAQANLSFFNQPVNNGFAYARHIARLSEDGLPRWTAQFVPDTESDQLHVSGDLTCVDKDDNFLFLSKLSGSYSFFKDASGTTINFSQTAENGTAKALVKIDKNGNYLWSKTIIPPSIFQFQGAVTTDNNGDVYLVFNIGLLTIDNTIIGTTTDSLSFIKLSGIDGSIIYSKNYDYRCYSFLPVFDAQNNLYVFTEPAISTDNNSYVFDSTTIQGNTQGIGSLMLKFNAQGDVVFGKDFYMNASNVFYSWPNDVVFDGTDFVLHGTLYADPPSDFVGMDGLIIPRSYTENYGEGFFAKITTSGTVLWQKPLETNMDSELSSYTNIDVDENHNFYVYYTGVKDKLKINGTEYNFNTVKGEKVLIKFDTDGNQTYLKSVDFGDHKASIDVFGVDKINVSSYTTENNILNYPINTINNYDNFPNRPKPYVATFGNLNSLYLTPVVNYSEVNNAVISNNGSDTNTYTFNLVNNVNWTATSNQPWLSLSQVNLAGKNTLDTSLSGSGDAKITLTAGPNTTGNDRSATVTLSGTGVTTKTILVTQSGTLSTPSNEFNANALVLYPNPAHFSIAFSEPVKELEITDVSGKTIKVFKGFNSDYTINDLAKGIYFVKGTTQNDSRFIKKLIKE